MKLCNVNQILAQDRIIVKVSVALLDCSIIDANLEGLVSNQGVFHVDFKSCMLILETAT